MKNHQKASIFFIFDAYKNSFKGGWGIIFTENINPWKYLK